MGNNKQQHKNTIYTRNLEPIEAGFRFGNITLFDKDEEEFDLFDVKHVKLCVSIPTLNNRAFTNDIAKLDILLKDFEKLKCYLITNEPAFTQMRLSKPLHLERFELLSDYKNREFARASGTYIYELGQLVKFVSLVDKQGNVLYVRYYDDLYSNFDLNETAEAIKKALDY